MNNIDGFYTGNRIHRRWKRQRGQTEKETNGAVAGVKASGISWWDRGRCDCDQSLLTNLKEGSTVDLSAERWSFTTDTAAVRQTAWGRKGERQMSLLFFSPGCQCVSGADCCPNLEDNWQLLGKCGLKTGLQAGKGARVEVTANSARNGTFVETSFCFEVGIRMLNRRCLREDYVKQCGPLPGPYLRSEKCRVDLLYMSCV